MIQELGFEKLKKKFALTNSYFKNRQHNAPSNPFEVLEYYKEHNELPYENGAITNNWFYECFCEYQKRAGVHGSQFFTPPNTAKRMVEILFEHTKFDEKVLDACCGFGQITQQLKAKGYEQIEAFDNDKLMVGACYDLHDSRFLTIFRHDFTSEETLPNKYDAIISNPPYGVRDLTAFLEFVDKHLYETGKAILLIPRRFLDKQRPAKLVKVLSKFHIELRELMSESFARTGAVAEIVVLTK